MKILVIYGSVRTARQGIKAARFVLSKLKERGHDAELVDPKEYNLPLLDKRYSDYRAGEAPALLEKLAKLVKEADGYVIVSGEYNHGIPPALSNLLDYFYSEYAFKPSAIVCYSMGPFGGVRAAMQLRALLSELRMPSIPSIFPISAVQDFRDDGTPPNEMYEKNICRFLDELEWYMEALKARRGKGFPY